MNAPMTLADVTASWLKAKEEERKAIEYRRQLDQMILSMLPKKEEGSLSMQAGHYKATVTYKMDRKVDTESLRSKWVGLSETAQLAIKWKADVSISVFRALSDQDKSDLSEFITTKPASPSVTVELVSQEQ